MQHSLPELEYPQDGLSPHISAETLQYHYGKHHNAYVTNLNKALEGTRFAEMSLEDIVRQSDGGLFNNAAQHYNHSFYWKCLKPGGGGAPGTSLAAAIDKQWGSFEAFKEAFSKSCATLFGSGWCWLVAQDGELKITQTSNAGCPLNDGQRPIMTCDVWEHAYYVDYRNARPSYVEAFWKLVNWDFAQANFDA